MEQSLRSVEKCFCLRSMLTVSSKVFVVIPELPGFAGDVKNESGLKTIMAAQYRTMNRGGSSIYEQIRKAGFEPYDCSYL